MKSLPLLLAGIVPLIANAKPDAIVAADGSTKFKTVQEAVNASPRDSSPNRPWTILLKPGAYNEVVYIQREKRFLKLIGEDAEKTVITHNLHANLPGPDGKPIGTFRTPTVQIDADHISFENITFENSAGPVGQALAVRVDGDRVSFRKCRFLGFQDTILCNRGRHYFEDCAITGAVDFIFGAATAWFEKCHILITRDGYITAASTAPEQNGFIFSQCDIKAEKPGIKCYLGRPWRPHAHTVFLKCHMDASIRPEGWENWRNPENEKTARYAEFQSTGPGAKPEKRVKWSRQLAPDEASKLTVKSVLGGDDRWNPTK